MMERQERKTLRAKRDQLLTLVNGWDPVGLLKTGAPRDEYECVVDKLFTVLSSGASEDEIQEFLSSEISEHFGLAPSGTSEFAKKVVVWHELAAVESE